MYFNYPTIFRLSLPLEKMPKFLILGKGYFFRTQGHPPSSRGQTASPTSSPGSPPRVLSSDWTAPNGRCVSIDLCTRPFSRRPCVLPTFNNAVSSSCHLRLRSKSTLFPGNTSGPFQAALISDTPTPTAPLVTGSFPLSTQVDFRHRQCQ